MKKEIYIRFLPVFLFIVSLACIDAGKLMAAVTTAAEMNTNLVRGDGYNSHYDFELTANDDTAKTGPMQKVRVDVIKNDVLTCDDYSLRIISNLDPVTQGTASIDGDFIVFTPGIEARGTTIPVQYGLTCNNVEVTAILYINITAYNTPINVVPEEQMCAEEMAQDIAFRIHNKYIGKATNGVLQPFSIPLVGDLNGDGKPEIVMFGVTGTGLTTPVRYIYIFDGQTGNVVLEFRLSTLGSWYGEFRIGDSPWHSSPSHMALADLDGDGIGEIIVCEADNDGNIYALKPVLNANGRITGLRKIWDSVFGVKQPLSGNYQTFGQAMPHIVDLNGDGIPEVVVYNKIYNGQTGKLLMAWNGGAASPRASTLAANTGLYDYRHSDVMHNATYSNNVKNRAMVGPPSRGLFGSCGCFFSCSGYRGY